MNALKTKRKAGVLEFEDRIVDQWINLQMVEDLEETDPADTLAEEPAQHRILRPDVALLGWDVLHDIVGSGTQDVFRCVGLVLGYARGTDVLLEELDRVCNLLHQTRE
ncbi:hypothetical protein ABIF64_008076 [Bradyrhizobium japonicum]